MLLPWVMPEKLQPSIPMERHLFCVTYSDLRKDQAQATHSFIVSSPRQVCRPRVKFWDPPGYSHSPAGPLVPGTTICWWPVARWMQVTPSHWYCQFCLFIILVEVFGWLIFVVVLFGVVLFCGGFCFVVVVVVLQSGLPQGCQALQGLWKYCKSRRFHPVVFKTTTTFTPVFHPCFYKELRKRMLCHPPAPALPPVGSSALWPFSESGSPPAPSTGSPCPQGCQGVPWS